MESSGTEKPFLSCPNHGKAAASRCRLLPQRQRGLGQRGFLLLRAIPRGRLMCETAKASSGGTRASVLEGRCGCARTHPVATGTYGVHVPVVRRSDRHPTSPDFTVTP